MTLAELQKGEWWWQRDNWGFTFDNETGHTNPRTKPVKGSDRFHKWFRWKGAKERSAHSYELIRRVHRELDLPRYDLLTNGERTFLKSALSELKDKLKPSRALASTVQMDGFSDSFPLHVNLEASDPALSAFFIQWVARQREKHKRSVKSHSTPKTKSWFQQQLLDCVYYKLPRNGMCDNPKTISQAKLDGDQAARLFARAALSELSDDNAPMDGLIDDFRCPHFKEKLKELSFLLRTE